MIDYQQYAQAMKEAHESLEQAATALKRQDLSSQERHKLSDDLIKKAERFRKLAMSFAVEKK